MKLLSSAGSLRFAAKPQKFPHIEWRLVRNPFPDPFNRDRGCCAKGSINQLTIPHERRKLHRRDLTQKPQHAYAVTNSRNVCAGFANSPNEIHTDRHLLTGVPRLKFLLL